MHDDYTLYHAVSSVSQRSCSASKNSFTNVKGVHLCQEVQLFSSSQLKISSIALYSGTLRILSTCKEQKQSANFE